MELKAIVDAIIGGDADEGLTQVSEALRQRRKALEAVKRTDFRVGDRVVFNQAAKPKYLAGIGATVIGLNPSTVVLNIDEHARARRFKGARGVRCPVAIVDIMRESVVA